MAWATVFIEFLLLSKLPCLSVFCMYVFVSARAYFIIGPWLFSKHANKSGIEMN
jgi:hypothetical protein